MDNEKPPQITRQYIDGNESRATRNVTSELVMRIPGVASIQLTPPLSVAELQIEADDANDAFEALKSRFGVKGLKEAKTLNERRIAAQREIDRLKEQEHATLKDASREEVEQAVMTMQSDCDSYLQQRNSTQALPASLDEAAARVSGARKELEDAQEVLDAQRAKSEDLRTEYEDVDSRLRVAQKELDGIEVALTIKQASLTESSPDSVEALLINARDVYKRANMDKFSEEKNHAVLADRLRHAQADGRYETMEAAERELEEREITFDATHRRAMAVELLWKTLNNNRNAARKFYVRPLKEAIVRLSS